LTNLTPCGVLQYLTPWRVVRHSPIAILVILPPPFYETGAYFAHLLPARVCLKATHLR